MGWYILYFLVSLLIILVCWLFCLCCVWCYVKLELSVVFGYCGLFVSFGLLLDLVFLFCVFWWLCDSRRFSLCVTLMFMFLYYLVSVALLVCCLSFVLCGLLLLGFWLCVRTLDFLVVFDLLLCCCVYYVLDWLCILWFGRWLT